MRRKPLGQHGQPKCSGHSSRTGLPCKRYAILGGTCCPTHGGSIGRVKRAAARRVADMLADAIDPDRVLREAGRLAYSDIRKLYDEQGKLLPIKQWPDDIAAAVSSVETSRGNVDKGDGQFDQVTRIRLWDKAGKLQDLMKHHGQLSETLNMTLAVNIGERLKAARKRLNGDRG